MGERAANDFAARFCFRIRGQILQFCPTQSVNFSGHRLAVAIENRAPKIFNRVVFAKTAGFCCVFTG
jgi:hypothetical protein